MTVHLIGMDIMEVNSSVNASYSWELTHFICMFSGTGQPIDFSRVDLSQITTDVVDPFDEAELDQYLPPGGTPQSRAPPPYMGPVATTAASHGGWLANYRLTSSTIASAHLQRMATHNNQPSPPAAHSNENPQTSMNVNIPTNAYTDVMDSNRYGNHSPPDAHPVKSESSMGQGQGQYVRDPSKFDYDSINHRYGYQMGQDSSEGEYPHSDSPQYYMGTAQAGPNSSPPPTYPQYINPALRQMYHHHANAIPVHGTGQWDRFGRP